MKRRTVIAGIASAGSAAGLRVVRAQPAAPLKRVAALVGGAESDPVIKARVTAFRDGLRQHNWVEGRNFQIDIRWGAADSDQINAYAKELVGLAPDVILGTNTPTMRALKQATTKIPIVFTGLADPITDGVVTNLSKPEGNITGFTSFNGAIGGKWLQLLREVAPATDHVAAIYNPDTAPFAIFMPVLEQVSTQLGIKLSRAPVKDLGAIERAVADLSSVPNGGLIVVPDVFTSLYRTQMFDFAAKRRVPSVCPLRSFVTGGGLISYGSNFDDLFRQAASYVDRILRGESPRDLPVQEPTRYELIVNQKTAKALALAIPPALLAQADEVIE